MGFLLYFITSIAHIIGDDVSNFYLEVLNNKKTLRGSKSTIISLIPKVKELKKVNEFRPISLYNVLYKIIAKCLTNRMKSMLTGIILEGQNSFLPRRLISDNSMIAFETLHSIKKIMKGKKSR